MTEPEPEIEILWDDNRRVPRGRYIIPCLLRDTETSVEIKAVLIDLNAAGCRVFTNDRRVRHMDEVLIGKVLRIEFDFYEVDTHDIRGEIVNYHPGKDPSQERQFGMKFVGLDPETARSIDLIIRRDLNEQ